ncbi:HlyD family secretion protein [Xenorhabdus griffiniae]|uniref:HlyD family efflux transporter periplasmic adaptor subunit n=1 Tax=Xenorhabdus griffiniae TaxID=351672 RepID=A0ABY9XCN0_9GAMM|nr:HlyD family efflux transporter periplasmic adaptor subunit [Xenorhabdus griffiniae]MBD1226448.1 HlyD family efflux transporter periplasmic adaptor subunit [Xenorhabdus griffiniae]MBE8587612.1 HlyD family efflux transporter periplasmic adaptor subunit [Xenorhabdus griffiniae]WMV70674.1 HlyD family efflux transporter periplasmic adaptor subunit [Xenorhabdus griffiniae]WNH00351.1 HlyD family efflux transporter periplasmic adaptor subunit [Xenorhabdus griffiniae]
MIKRYRWAIAGIFIVVACFLVFLSLKQSPAQESVQWIEVKQAVIEKQLGLVGHLQSARLETIPAPFDAIIKQVSAKEGQWVKAGQTLVTLDTRKIDIDLRQAEVEMIKASSVVDQLHDWENSQEVIRARRNVESANHMVMELKNNLAKTQALFSRGIVPKMEVENLQQQLRRQLTELASVQDDLASIRQKGSMNNVRVAEMELQNATSRYQTLQEQYLHKEIKAPFSGVVLRATQGESKKLLTIQTGVRVTEGMPLLEIMDTTQYQVLAQVEETDLAKLKEGQAVKITGEGFSQHPLDGEIETIAMQSVNTDKPGSAIYYDIVIKVTSSMNQSYPIRPGMSAKVNIVIYRNEQGIVVPEAALTRANNGQLTVNWRPDLTQLAVTRQVTVGEAMPKGIEVHGLEEGFIALPR